MQSFKLILNWAIQFFYVGTFKNEIIVIDQNPQRFSNNKHQVNDYKLSKAYIIIIHIYK